MANVVVIEGRASILIWARNDSVRQAYGSPFLCAVFYLSIIVVLITYYYSVKLEPLVIFTPDSSLFGGSITPTCEGSLIKHLLLCNMVITCYIHITW